MGIDYGLVIRDVMGSRGAMIPPPPPVAVAQTVAVDGDLAANIRQHLALVEIAAQANPGIVLFPELSLTGYLVDRAGEMAIDLTDHRLLPLRESARTHDTIIIAGAPLKRSGNVYLTALIFYPSGLLDVYAKRRLGVFGPAAAVDGSVPPPEDSVFTPGGPEVPIPWGRHEAGLGICADIGDPEQVAAFARRRAAGYLASMFVIPSEYAADARRLSDYAAEYGMVVAMANHGGATGGLAAAGRSAIWDGQGKLLGRLDAEGTGVLVAEAGEQGWSARVHSGESMARS